MGDGGGGWVIAAPQLLQHGGIAGVAVGERFGAMSMIGELEFCLRVGAVSRLVAECMDKSASDAGLSVGPASVLVAVAASPGQTQVAYSTALVINDATLTLYIDRLEDADFLEWRRGRQNRWVVRLHLTSAGADKARQLSREFSALETRFSDALGGKQFAKMSEDLRNLALALANHGAEA